MSIISVVKDVCLAIGVNSPTSLFASSVQPRTQAELLSLANEMAQRIAYDVREWAALRATALFTGDGVKDRFPLPANFKRLLLTSQVYPSWSTRQPLSFIASTDEWLKRRLNNDLYNWGEWTIIGGDMLIHPVMGGALSVPTPVVPPQQVTFAYLDKNCIKPGAGGDNISQFMNDADEFRLSERLLKLGMIWQWKANKGSPYAEDMGTYSDALVMEAGSDSPAPIIMGDGRRRMFDAYRVA